MKIINWSISLVWASYFLILGLFVIGSLLANPEMTLFNRYKAFITQSGSMERTIMTGDIIIDDIARVKNSLHEGDIITFKDEKNHTVTHRIIKLATKNNQTYITTKGDNNNAPDPDQIETQNVIGFYRWRLPYLGYLIVNLRKPAGLLLMILIPVGLTALGELIKKDDDPVETQPTSKVQTDSATVESLGSHDQANDEVRVIVEDL